MANCPECKEQVPDSAHACPNCGARVIPASKLEQIVTKTTTWQKIVIIVGLIVLIAIGFTFQDAGKRENSAAQSIFSGQVSDLIAGVSMHTGLANTYGTPGHTLYADTKTARISIHFPRGPLSARQAQVYATSVCGLVARAYVEKGYMPRRVTVAISSAAPKGTIINYGKAVYDGNLDTMQWRPEAH